MLDVAVIVAAGKGERMGDFPKALATIQGETLLSLACGLFAKRTSRIIVVTGFHSQQVGAAATELGCTVVHNEQPALGMGSSVLIGLRAATEFNCDGAWFSPVDFAKVSDATLEQLASSRAMGRTIVPTFAGRGGHPIWLSRSVILRILQLDLERRGGLRAVLGEVGEVLRIAVPDRAIMTDIDTWDDLAKIP